MNAWVMFVCVCMYVGMCKITMARLGTGIAGMAQAIGLVTLAPGGTVAVPAALVFDEVEHYRAGEFPISLTTQKRCTFVRPCSYATLGNFFVHTATMYYAHCCMCLDVTHAYVNVHTQE